MEINTRSNAVRLLDSMDLQEKTRFNNLVEQILHLGDVEIDIVSRIVERLSMGQTLYGKINLGNPKNCVKEATDELLDGTVYLTWHLLQLAKSEGNLLTE